LWKKKKTLKHDQVYIIKEKEESKRETYNRWYNKHKQEKITKYHPKNFKKPKQQKSTEPTKPKATLT